MRAVPADLDARMKVEGQLSEKYEKRREHLLLSAVQTLEAMDRAIEAARNSDALESLVNLVAAIGALIALTVSERARLRELERETRELKMENEFLKKAAAYFARDHR